jgi:hypothetical protein
MFLDKTPQEIRCPHKCNKGWLGEPELRLDDGKWAGWSQCAGCGAYSVWRFNPDKPLASQKLYVSECYDGFWQPPE